MSVSDNMVVNWIKAHPYWFVLMLMVLAGLILLILWLAGILWATEAAAAAVVLSPGVSLSTATSSASNRAHWTHW